MRAPRLHALRLFDAAARHLNFRLAGRELNLTQGAVAQTVRGLEADLGIRLFTRLARGLALTEQGERYHSEVAGGLAIIDQATRNLYSSGTSVAVSVPPSFASKWLVPRLPYFSERHPEVEVRTIASEAVSDFRTQQVDVAVRLGPRPVDKGLVVRRLAPLDLCAVCSPRLADEHGGPETPEDFAGAPLIQDGHRYWQALFGDHSIECPDRYLQFNQTALALDAAANGQGFAIAPRILAAGDMSAGRLVQVWEDRRAEDRGFWLLHPEAEGPNHKARSQFVAWLLAESGPHDRPSADLIQ